MFRFLHAADFHLDSPFAGLTPQQAAARRRESREAPFRLAEYAAAHSISLVLLAGDLFDSDSAYRETGESLRDALGQIGAPVLIAPGNHDWYGPGSPYAAMPWPENVHIFSSETVESVAFPELHAVVHGAAFTSPEQPQSPLSGFHAPEDGNLHLMVLHGELNAAESRYHPLSREEVAGSGLAYLALGHIHKPSDPLQIGRTTVAWPGCLEGRGFDEPGPHGFYEGTVADDGTVSLRMIPCARRRYETVRVDVSGKDPADAVAAALPDGTENDLYRVILTGETDERGADPEGLRSAFASRFYSLEVQDGTCLQKDLWAAADEDSLRGLFLRNLREKLDAADSEEKREIVTRAARFGLTALDHRDLG